MIKLMVFVSRLPQVDRGTFKEYYESKHAPMIPSLMPMLSGYERNYPDVSKIRPPEGKTVDDMINFDAMTILRFKDREAFEAYKRALRDPEIMSVIRADEANFLDNTKTRLFVIEEHVSDLSRPRHG